MMKIIAISGYHLYNHDKNSIKSTIIVNTYIPRNEPMLIHEYITSIIFHCSAA